jgi:lipoprotein NlpD
VRTFQGQQSIDQGIDIEGVQGQDVLASADGRVVYSGSGLAGFGQLIIIKHNDTYISAYGHNQSLLVREGVEVKAGQKIAEMGKQQGSPRLHFEIRRQGKPVDPLKYLPGP